MFCLLLRICLTEVVEQLFDSSLVVADGVLQTAVKHYFEALFRACIELDWQLLHRVLIDLKT